MADEHHAKDHPLIVSAQISEAKWPDQPLIVSRTKDEVRWTQIESVIKLILKGLSLMLTGILPLSVYLVRYHEERATERQAQAAGAASQLQLSISRAQVAASLMPSIVKGSPKERETALFILSSAAPDLAKDISNRNAQTPQEKQLAQEVNQLSNQASEDQDFTQHLDQARVYQRFGLSGQADREFIRASGLMSSRIKVDHAKLQEAKSLYASNRFDEAASSFDEAFKDASSQ